MHSLWGLNRQAVSRSALVQIYGPFICDRPPVGPLPTTATMEYPQWVLYSAFLSLIGMIQILNTAYLQFTVLYACLYDTVFRTINAARETRSALYRTRVQVYSPYLLIVTIERHRKTGSHSCVQSTVSSSVCNYCGIQNLNLLED